MLTKEETIDKNISSRGLDLDALEHIGARRRALIVDDEVDTVDLVKTVLMNAGIDVTGACSGSSALEKTIHIEPDVILLDLMMPEMDGWETFLRLKKITRAPIIFLSARNQKEDVVKGLRFGVDDYITKPFHPAELAARVHTLVKRSRVEPITLTYSFPKIGLDIDVETREVVIHGKLVNLTAKEMSLLTLLARHPSKWVPNSAIALGVWGDDSPRVEKRIKYLVFLLRRELEEDPARPRLILSRENLGYKLDVSESGG